MPIAENGIFEFDVTDKGRFLYKSQVRIVRIQIEQDSGKSLHNVYSDCTLVDLNRAGIGLLEIVFAPELSTPVEAASCLRAIQKIFRHIGVCDGKRYGTWCVLNSLLELDIMMCVSCAI